MLRSISERRKRVGYTNLSTEEKEIIKLGKAEGRIDLESELFQNKSKRDRLTKPLNKRHRL